MEIDPIFRDAPTEGLKIALVVFERQLKELMAGKTLLVGLHPKFEVSGPKAIAHAQDAIDQINRELAERDAKGGNEWQRTRERTTD